LREAARRVRAEGYEIGNVDATVIAQQPKLAPHIGAMVSNLAEDLGIAAGRCNVKAKTNEKLGFEGRQEGIVAQAAVLIWRTPAGEQG
jgi:2-C-methyl-D-erythritol 2,4-cyclodiphosphate synthase